MARAVVGDAPSTNDRWTKENATVLTVCVLGWVFRRLRTDGHADCHANLDLRMGNFTRDHRKCHNNRSLGWAHRHIRIPGAGGFMVESQYLLLPSSAIQYLAD